MNMVKIICACCGVEFERYVGEVKRSEQLSRKHYCSRKCCGDDNNKHLHKFGDISRMGGRTQVDVFSPFRYNLKTARNHSKRNLKEFAITLQNLKDRWEKQGGVCPYTGWQLELPPTSGKAARAKIHPARASLDRIDSNKGYIPENIQFVAYMANIAKNSFADEELFEFCRAVVIMREVNGQ